MSAVMARIRITIDTEESHKRAFLAAASIAGKSPQEFFEWMVEQLCPDDLERAKTAISLGTSEDDDDDSGPKKTPPRGKKH